MSNKAPSELTPTDQIIRGLLPAVESGPYPSEGKLVSITFVQGFEKFNTRPYHNYETWGNGYRIEGFGVTVEKEDLDEAIAAWALAVWEAHVV